MFEVGMRVAPLEPGGVVKLHIDHQTGGAGRTDEVIIPLLALSGHSSDAYYCLLSGVKPGT